MKWTILTLVGEDQPGLVASVTNALYQQDCHLAQASMMQLGANFAIMLRVSHERDKDLRAVLKPICTDMNLHCHIDDDTVVDVTRQVEPDVQVTVYGADQPGIVAHVTIALALAGLDIIDLETNVGGGKDNPIYIMTLVGVALKGVAALQSALDALSTDIEVNLDEINTLRG